MAEAVWAMDAQVWTIVGTLSGVVVAIVAVATYIDNRKKVIRKKQLEDAQELIEKHERYKKLRDQGYGTLWPTSEWPDVDPEEFKDL